MSPGFGRFLLLFLGIDFMIWSDPLSFWPDLVLTLVGGTLLALYADLISTPDRRSP